MDLCHPIEYSGGSRHVLMDGGDAARAMPHFEVAKGVGAGISQRGFDPLCLCVVRFKVILTYTNTSFLFDEVNSIGYYIIG
jgi:hypothetical protein